MKWKLDTHMQFKYSYLQHGHGSAREHRGELCHVSKAEPIHVKYEVIATHLIRNVSLQIN